MAKHLIVVGASSVGVISALIRDKNREVLICLLPLLLIAIGYFIFRRIIKSLAALQLKWGAAIHNVQISDVLELKPHPLNSHRV